MTPPISYLTLVDKFVLLCSAVMALNSLEAALIAQVRDRAEIQPRYAETGPRYSRDTAEICGGAVTAAEVQPGTRALLSQEIPEWQAAVAPEKDETFFWVVLGFYCAIHVYYAIRVLQVRVGRDIAEI